ncbi:MAG: hypothetical protein M3542_05970 [Acidobacteriota bacterium]|nr:hypothetical protein [Acidobacteriota bacterium]MDQ5871555.1 hypothetical protein [Acidobacteriota bacterium]
MSSATPGPRCPRCRRPLAAWRLPHCVYCGETFPADLKEGFDEPDAMKWIERPAIPQDAARQLELLKVLPWEPKKKRPGRALVFAAGFSVAAFTGIFVLLFQLLRRQMPSLAAPVVLVGIGFIGYLVWVFSRARRRTR